MSSTQYVVDTALWLDALDTCFFYFKSIFKLAYEAFIMAFPYIIFVGLPRPSSPLSLRVLVHCTCSRATSHFRVVCPLVCLHLLNPAVPPLVSRFLVWQPIPTLTSTQIQTGPTWERAPVIFEFLSLGNWFELVFYVELICFLANFIFFSLWLNKIPLRTYAFFSLSVHQLMDICAGSTSWLLWTVQQ